MRSFLVLALTLLGGVLLLTESSTRIGGLVVPQIDTLWILAAALLLLVLRIRSGKPPLSMSRFLLVAGLLGLSAWRFDELWTESRRPASPLVVTVRAAGGRPLAVEPLDSLDLSERRYVARVAGRRRSFSLEIEGFLFVPRTGRYRFELLCDDRCDLRLDGRSRLAGSGALTQTLELDAGTKRFTLRYRQDAGPAFLVARWDGPPWLEPFPLEAHLAGAPEDLESGDLRYNRGTPWALGALALLWLATASFVAIRAAESLPAWGGALTRWWRGPPPERPVALVRPGAWSLTGTVFLALGAIGRLRLPDRLQSLAEEYAVNPRRAPFVLERIEAFPDYLFFLGALAFLVAIVLRELPSPFAPSTASSPGRWNGWLVAAIAGTLLWGAWISQDEWVRYGRPCYDGYCDYAERVRAYLVQPGQDTAEALREHLARNYHANSPVGPILIAIAGLWISDIVVAYRLISALATLGTAVLLVVIVRRELELGRTTSLLAVFLFTACGSVQRSFLFPQTDALAMFFFTLAVERVLALRRKLRVSRYLASVLSIAAALLTKLSALPLAAITVVLAAWPLEGRWSFSASLRRLGRSAAVVLPPLLLVLAYVLALRTTDNVRTELHRIETLDSRPSFHVVATVVTLLPFLLALALTRGHRWRRKELALGAATGIYLVGLWASGASGWERFYLNAMPMAVPLAVARFAPFAELRSRPHLVTLLTAYTVAHAVRMLLHLYNGA